MTNLNRMKVKRTQRTVELENKPLEDSPGGRRGRGRGRAAGRSEPDGKLYTCVSYLSKKLKIVIIVIIFQNYNVVKLVFRKLINGILVMI